MAAPKLKYSIIRVIRHPNGKVIKFFVRNRFGFKVFGFKSFQMLTKKYRKAGLEFDVVYHRPHYPNATHVTPHFTWAEFASNKAGSPCCPTTPVPRRLRKNAVRLGRALEMMRAILGHPTPLLSVFRTWPHNSHVGGASASQHPEATAADHAVPPGNQRRYVAAAKQVPAIKGIGIYPNGGVHTDVRRGARVFWDSWGR